MNTTLVSTKDLMDWLEFEQVARVEKWLRDNRIPYTYGKGGRPITTADAINKVLIGEDVRERIEF